MSNNANDEENNSVTTVYAKPQIFNGAATALITPFKNGEVDTAAFDRLIERQICAGIDAIVIGGTTAEAATLSDSERYHLFERARDVAGGRTKLIFGTGTNDTVAAIRHTISAERIGCDGVLLVTPYYNKGTKEGLARHYELIADSTSLPILLYNVPSRTGVSIDLDTLQRLSERNNIVGIKEASDSQDRLTSISAMGDRLHLYAGNDSAIYTTLALGGSGVISVISNLYPVLTVNLCKQFFAHNHTSALKTQHAMLPMIRALFRETNPSPIKYAMSKLGLCSEEMRLPLSLPTQQTIEEIETAMATLTTEP